MSELSKIKLVVSHDKLKASIIIPDHDKFKEIKAYEIVY